MRYAYNEQQLVNVSKLVKKLLHETFSNANKVTLSMIKDEISLILGYRNSNEIKSIGSVKKDKIKETITDNLSDDLYLSDFCKIFGTSTLVRFLNGNLSKNKVSLSSMIVIENQLTQAIMDYSSPDVVKDICDFIEHIDFNTYYFGENNDIHVKIRHYIENINGVLLCKISKEDNVFKLHISIRLRNCLLSGLPCEIKEKAQIKINDFINNPCKNIFLICAPPGRGKSYFIENVIIPQIKEAGQRIVRVMDRPNKILPGMQKIDHISVADIEANIDKYDVFIWEECFYNEEKRGLIRRIVSNNKAIVGSTQDDSTYTSYDDIMANYAQRISWGHIMYVSTSLTDKQVVN